LENDADAAALGECFVGAGRGADPVAMLTFGTGIGGAVVLKGKVYRGVNGEHPELGHVPVRAKGPQCYCGARGCLEALASGTAIGLAGQALGLADAREVFAAARAGNLAAARIVARALEATASATWTLLHTFLPQRLILGGGMMAEYYELFAAVVRERIGAATMAPREQISVLPAALGNDAGVVGAASLAFSDDQKMLTGLTG
jgi:glucokinase